MKHGAGERSGRRIVKGFLNLCQECRGRCGATQGGDMMGFSLRKVIVAVEWSVDWGGGDCAADERDWLSNSGTLNLRHHGPSGHQRKGENWRQPRHT